MNPEFLVLNSDWYLILKFKAETTPLNGPRLYKARQGCSRHLLGQCDLGHICHTFWYNWVVSLYFKAVFHCDECKYDTLQYGVLSCMFYHFWSYWTDRAGLSWQPLMFWNHVSTVTGYHQLQCWFKLINRPIWNGLHTVDNGSICLLSLCGNAGCICLSYQDSCWCPEAN